MTPRRFRALPAAAFGCAAALAGACNRSEISGSGVDPGAGDVSADGWTEELVPEPSDFTVSVTAAQPQVEIGGEIVLKVRVENRGDVPAKLNVPRLGRDSVTFKVRGDSFDVAWLDPIRVKESPRGSLPDPPEVREIGKGEAVEGEVKVAAVITGRLVFAPVYTCLALPVPLAGKPVAVEVMPAAGGSRLGFRMETTHGTLDATFRPEIAFQTCTAFATLIRRGFFDGVKFHRVVAGFMAQGGDPQGQGWGGPGYMLRRELHGKLPHRRGVFSMARQQAPDTAGSQFFVMFRMDPNLDQLGYTTFAEMTSGEDALRRLEAVGSMGGASEAPTEPVTIRKVTLAVVK